ncbi:MAG: hypothetical protein PHD43_24385 [Methylococcales bacterium]|nr:hypothetical protein [Methylococcales bacterium]
MKNKIEFDRVCESCKGTGLYIGMAERDGAAVVCHKCKGTGCEHISIEYESFTERKISEKVKRVFRVNPGIIYGGPNLSLFGGMPVYEWLRGLPFPPGSEDRLYSCPCWFYQIADYKKKPEWRECQIGCTFSNCRQFFSKESCWERWDREFGNK